MAIREIVICKRCSAQNRIKPETGTKGIICGRCREDLPTPAVLLMLMKVRDELAYLLKNYRWFDVMGHREIESRLRKQQLILANAAGAYPGYERTWRASVELAAEIEAIGEQLKRKLEREPLKLAIQFVIAIVRLVHLDLPLPLPR